MGMMEGSMRIQIMVLICCLLVLVPVYGAPVKDTVTLKGVVVTDAGSPVTNTRITVSGGPGVFTSEKGEFLLNLSKDYLEGEQVHLLVYKEGWVINHPLDGLWNLPNIRYQDTHTTRVVLVPPGSKALWSHERIEKHIALLATEVAKRPLPVGERPRPIDFSFYLKQWAEKYGFTPEEVKEQFDRWAEDTKESTDYRTLGLREFYKRNFIEASGHFDKAAIKAAEEQKRLKEQLRLKTLALYENWRDSGNALFAAYKFREALDRFRRAEQTITIKGFRMQWAEIQFLMGNAGLKLAACVSGKEGGNLLRSSIESYGRTLKVYTRKDLPQMEKLV